MKYTEREFDSFPSQTEKYDGGDLDQFGKEGQSL